MEQSRARRVVEEAGGVFVIAGLLYLFPSLRHSFYTADGWRTLGYGFLDWWSDMVHHPLASTVVFATTGALIYFRSRLLKR